jgi:hypothetical protein
MPVSPFPLDKGEENNILFSRLNQKKKNICLDFNSLVGF